MEILHLTQKTFQETVAEGTVLVDFWAGWCLPCKMLAPVLEELAAAFDNVRVAKVDVDAEGILALEYGVMSIPTVVMFQDGQEVRRFVGVQPKDVFIEALSPDTEPADPEDTNEGEEE
ncbi:thioredoxin [Oscillospiraceae bacterium CM]|nr:thioredoxin [Oscillospiraceae bacterium CM]